jgi:hypothetical protein
MSELLDNPQLSLFSERLPHRPYCSDDLGAGLRILPLQAALTKRYIQYNPPASINWMVFDIDRVYVHDSEWANLAVPNIIARNPANGHAHLFYGIVAGVSKTSASRAAPLRLLAAINESYRHILGGDVGFTELICKNPLHSHWNVEVLRADLYDLHELAEYVDLDASDKRVRATPKRSQVGLGRNCNLFNSLRTWCYKWVCEYQGGSLERWHEAVRGKAEKLNTFKDALPASEIKATAKSVAKWTWANYTGKMTASSLAEDGLTPKTFSLLQSNLGKMAMAKRWGDNSEKKSEAVKMAAGGLSAREIASQLSVGHATVSRWLKATVS